MPDLDKEQLLADWLDGNLSDTQRREFEDLCMRDPAFEAQVSAANQWVMHAESYQSEPVPGWDRDVTFDRPAKQHWWNWQGLPVFSTAMSTMAIVLVLTGFQVSVKDGAVTMRFGAQDTEAQVESLVRARLADFQQNQQTSLTTFAQALQQQQLDASTQLTNYLLTSSRQERREDFAEFVKFINQQRNDDQQFYARQLNKLERKLSLSDTEPTWPENSSMPE